MNIRLAIPKDLRGSFDAAVADWTSTNNVDRFWKKDASLWTNQDEAKWLNWSDVVGRQQQDAAAFASLADEVKAAGFESVLLLGMGGSSLCPEVLSVTFGRQAGFPALHIVDSTDPVQVKSIRNKVDLKKTLVIVASKSGSTLEPNILKQYFFEEMKNAVGAQKAGSQFIAITDPGSKMEQVAKADGFWKIFYGDPKIGGRYSALSNFGLIPAAVTGLDTGKLLAEAAKAVDAAKQPLSENLAAQLGLLMGVAANKGRDKITLFTSPEIYDLGAWLEQLIAESTGKLGKGITPVDREAIGAPEVYGKDRIFAYIRLANSADKSQDAAVAAIEAAGHPVIHIELNDLYEIFGQFFTWEVATAVAGAVMGINPFDQPDVEAAKIETRRLTSEYEQTGRLPASKPMIADEGLLIFASEEYAKELKVGAGASLGSYLRAHLSQIKAGDYFAILAYIPMFSEHEAAIQEFRHRVRDMKRVATCLGFGPRFLHSTGQDYKGGPNTGVFLQITADHAQDLPIPGQKYTFGVVIDAQAAGDLAVLESRGRRALRVHLRDVEKGLDTLRESVDAALRAESIR
jgi:glucose-6-phosphate isomerase